MPNVYKVLQQKAMAAILERRTKINITLYLQCLIDRRCILALFTEDRSCLHL